MAQKLPLYVPALQIKRSPGETSWCPDGEQRLLLEQTPQGRNPKKMWKTSTSPEVAGCSRPKKARRSLHQAAKEDIRRARHDSGSEEELTDDEFEDFKALRQQSRTIREEVVMSEEESEEVMQERVVKEEEEISVNESVEENAELGAMGPEFFNLDDFSWSDDFSTFSGQEELYLRTPGPSFATQDPLDAFLSVWNESIMNIILKQTNKYAWDKIASLTEVGHPIPEPLSSWTETSTEELYVYFGVLIVMSICNRSCVNEYWSTDLIGMPDFRKLMSRNRFILISRFLHFVDNDNCNSSLSSYEKKVNKIKPILDHVNKRFAELYTPNKHLSLDESLLLWKGRLSWVQCIRTKAARFGIKSFELCEAETGYLLRCLIYAGKNSSMSSEPIHGFENSTAKVVLKLMDGFLDVGHTLVMDNWYNQMSLTRYLKRRRTDVIGTMNPFHVHVPADIKNANGKEMRRGDQIARHCGDISLVAWKDVKLVTTVSTYHKDNQVPATRAGLDMTKPAAIAAYNKYMGGVDSKDQQLSMFLMERKRGRKWYMKVFKRLVNTSLLNTYIIFRKNPMASKQLSHRDYRMAVAKGLFSRFCVPVKNRPNKGEPIPGRPRRLVEAQHFVAHTELKVPGGPARKPKRCVRCTAAGRRSMVTLMCTYCQVPLCAGDCWAEYHTLPKL